ncbi:hypothetical protein GE09DRAFT_948496 [Coniochaeta sp. 2T2.1]|nr:hypothetical protein GE09DRAFT_948496 [Coniochaeta sp. 2T2.1]
MSVLVFENSSGRSRSVKRPRPVKSCTECRKRKLKCDRNCPCSQCQKSQRICKYSPSDEAGNASDGSDVETPERPPAKRPTRPSVAPSGDTPGFMQQNGPGSSFGNAAPMDEISSRFDRLERLLAERATEQRPSKSHQFPHVPAPAVTIRALSVKGGLRTRFFGQNSTKVLLNLFSEAKQFMNNMAQTDGARELFVTLQKVYKALQEDHKRLLEPITVFVDSMMPVLKRMADILPKRPVCDRLLEAYIGASEGLYRVVHLPTFRQEYERYWDGKGHCEAFLPRLLCMMSLGSRFETEARGLGHDRLDSVHAPTALALVRNWLDGLRGKHLVDINTLQAEVLLVHAQRTITMRHQESWSQLGLIVRMAMTMGLHRDPSEFAHLSPFVAENRRKLWYTIMDMDLHVALQCNLPCAVREGEYTCQAPRNIDDNDLYPDMRELPPSKPLDYPTSTQMQAYAASTLPARMRVAYIVNKLDTIKDYSEILDAGMKLEQMIDDVNSIFPRQQALDTQQKFKEWRLRALLDMHVRRPLLALYRPFAMGTVTCPPHILNSYLKSSMTILTYMDELDHSVPGFQDVDHMYQLVLKQDIIQAAFSVCYFIKTAPDTNSQGHWNPGVSPGPSEASSSATFDARPIFSAATLTATVEKTMDSLIALIKDSSSDIRDIVALSVVLSSVQAGTAEQRFERITSGVRKILDTCLQSLKTKPGGNISTLPVSSAMLQCLLSRLN